MYNIIDQLLQIPTSYNEFTAIASIVVVVLLVIFTIDIIVTGLFNLFRRRR